MVKTEVVKNFKAMQEQIRGLSVHPQEGVKEEVKKLIDQDHITIQKKCIDNQLISSIVITVQNDQSIKLALDSKQISKQ